jgi:hypothetical protein
MEDHVANQIIRCKRIIDGRTYNTETAILLGHWEQEDGLYGEYLFKARHGAYFLYVDMMWEIPSLRIMPQTPEEAENWTREHCSAEVYEAEFGHASEAGDPEARFTMRMPETLRRRIAAIAQTNKQSLNAWVVQCLETAADASALPASVSHMAGLRASKRARKTARS